MCRVVVFRARFYCRKFAIGSDLRCRRRLATVKNRGLALTMRVKSPQDLASGLLLIVIGILGYVLIRHLPTGTAFRMGPAYMPTVVSWMIVGVGVVLAVRSLLVKGLGVSAADMRPFWLVLGSFALFGMLIEDGGLAAASLVLILMAGFADRDHRWREAIIFATALTVFAVLVFKVLLGLPMAVWPRWI